MLLFFLKIISKESQCVSEYSFHDHHQKVLSNSEKLLQEEFWQTQRHD